jgi:hypothetical protein
VAAVDAAQPKETVRKDAALQKRVELVFDGGGRLASAAVSTWAKKVSACCCTRRYSVVCTGR